MPAEQRACAASSRTSSGRWSTCSIADAIQIDTLNDSTFAYSVLPGKRAQRTMPVGGNSADRREPELRIRDPFFPEPAAVRDVHRRRRGVDPPAGGEESRLHRSGRDARRRSPGLFAGRAHQRECGVQSVPEPGRRRRTSPVQIGANQRR